MEAPICTRALINNIIVFLTGCVNKNLSVVKVNAENLSKNGELYFLLNLKAWKCLHTCGNVCQCKTILQHFLQMQNVETNGKTELELTEQVAQQLISASSEWSMKIRKCSLERERVCIFLNRLPIIQSILKAAVENGANFGRCLPINRVFHLQVSKDNESELTTIRLYLLKTATEKLLNLNGCKIVNDETASKLLLTTKSEGKEKEDYEKYICGVVKNSKSKSKEVSLTWIEHIQKKIENLEELNEHKLFGIECHKIDKQSFLKDLAIAEATFELLSIKPSHPVLIGHNVASDKNVTNTKGVSFILYNTARIATILSKYNDRRLKGEYPDLPNITDVDLSYLEQEEEWDLIYNFILEYPQIIKDSIKYDDTFQTSPQVICIFLSRLCQKFSVYYRKTRILTEAYDHLVPAMFARLYMIHALQIVFQNALDIFGIKTMSHM